MSESAQSDAETDEPAGPDGRVRSARPNVSHVIHLWRKPPEPGPNRAQ